MSPVVIYLLYYVSLSSNATDKSNYDKLSNETRLGLAWLTRQLYFRLCLK